MYLPKVRKKIDKLDFELIRILSERTKTYKNIARYKQKNKIPVVQKQRMKEMFKKRRALAKESGLDPDFVERIFSLIIGEAIRIQKKLISKKRHKI